MEAKNLEILKIKLEEKKAELIKQLDNIGHRVKGSEINFDSDFPEYGDSLEDSAAEVADYANNLSLERDLEKQLRDVEKSLKKITDGGYGVCSYCGQEIEIDRLMARPESSACVACKKKLQGAA